MGIRSDSDEGLDLNGLVLVGDSVIEGGAMVDQHDTVGHHLFRAMQEQVYPVGGGGWSLCNELAFLEENPEFLDVKDLVLVINSGDLCELNIWKTENTHPTHSPSSHVAYLLGRFTWNVLFSFQERYGKPDFVLVDDIHQNRSVDEMSKFIERYKHSLTVIFYPDRAELARGIKPCSALRSLSFDDVLLVDLIEETGWRDDCYHDRLHPNAKGRRALAEIISRHVCARRWQGLSTGE